MRCGSCSRRAYPGHALEAFYGGARALLEHRGRVAYEARSVAVLVVRVRTGDPYSTEPRVPSPVGEGGVESRQSRGRCRRSVIGVTGTTRSRLPIAVLFVALVAAVR